MSKVSVIIPTHNRKDLLIRAIRSVLNQSYQNFEIVVIDDFGISRDCIELDPRIKYVRVHSDGYIANSRNAGILRSSGELVAFLDDDDVWLPHKLLKHVAIMDRNPYLVMCCSNMYDVSTVEEIPAIEHFPDKPRMEGNLLNEAILRMFICTPTVITRRIILNRTGGFFVHPDLKVGEDTDLWLRIAALGEIYYDRTPFTIRLHDPKGCNITRDLYSTKEGRTKAYRALRLCNERLLAMDVPRASKFYAWLQVWNNIIKIQEEQLI